MIFHPYLSHLKTLSLLINYFGHLTCYNSLMRFNSLTIELDYFLLKLEINLSFILNSPNQNYAIHMVLRIAIFDYNLVKVVKY